MAAKKTDKTIFRCGGCGHEEARWLGRCPRCGQWNSFKEEQHSATVATRLAGSGALANTLPLNAIKVEDTERISCGIPELDRVLGGGIMNRSCVLIGGEPGIGKSTLLLQSAAANASKGRVLYISGEESAEQIRQRADRLELSGERIEVFCSGELASILKVLERIKPAIIVVDSVQTLHSADIGLVPGTVNQMKYCSMELISWAKERGSALFLVAHVTKEGFIAGPKALEHMVDCVLYFEQNETEHRFIRAVKNRFGSVDELGIFVMGEKGLISQDENAALFLIPREGPPPAGVATAAVLEGNRVLLLEIQALTVPAKGASSRISSERIDSNRVSRIAASIEKHLGLRLSDQDVYINVSGGVRVHEVGVDLAIAAAIHSARTGVSLPKELVFAGELSLAGELRPIRKLGVRIKTAESLGFTRFIGPPAPRGEVVPTSAKLVQNLGQAIKFMLD